MKQVDFLLTGGVVVTMDGERQVFDPGAVAVCGTDIVAVGSVEPGSYGSLLGVITGNPGNNQMPPSGIPLSDCDITQITNWINDGMPDN